MRHILNVAALLALTTSAALAQAPETADGDAVETRRAPLAMPDDIGPAVETGRLERPAGRGGLERPAPAPAAPAAPPSPGAPASAGRATRTIDTLDLGTTSITGNQELPKVLYIVPWKRSDLGDLAGRPVNTLLDEVLAPIDPEVFERQLNYFDSLYGTTPEE